MPLNGLIKDIHEALHSRRGGGGGGNTPQKNEKIVPNARPGYLKLTLKSGQPNFRAKKLGEKPIIRAKNQ